MNDTIFYWGTGEDSLGVSRDISLPGMTITGNRIQTFELTLETGII